jgi:transcriptional regulator with XRE-family HTH domain
MDVLYKNTHDWWFTNPWGCGTQPRVPRRKAIAQKNRPRPAVLRPLGAQLRRLRLDRKWSQEYLAELAGLNYKYVGRIELGKADPGADVLVRLARALSVPVGELFDTITPPDSAPYRLLPSDVESVATALSALQTTIDRVLARQPRPLPARAPRRPRR